MPLNIKPYINLFDKSFKATHTRTYVMSVVIDMKGMVLCIFNPEKNKQLALAAYRFDELESIDQIPGFFDNILNDKAWFAFPFMDVNILVRNKYSTLVPMPLFTAEKKNLYLGFNHTFQENSRIVFDTLKNTEAVHVYYLPNPLVEKVKDLWPNARLFHASSTLIESLGIGFKNKMDDQMLFLEVHPDTFNLVYFKNHKLHFYNQFSYRTKEDFAYFLLAATEQLSLNPEEVKLMLLGDIDKGTPIYNLLYQYIRHISFIGRNDAIGYSYVLDDIRPHHFYSLFNIQQCGL